VKRKTGQVKTLRNDQAAPPAARADGWMNLFTGLGIQKRDKTLSTTISRDVNLQENDLTLLFRFNGLAKRIVELPVGEMTRKGFTIKNDTDGILLKAFNDMAVAKEFRNLIRWSKVYGGAIMVLWIDDGAADMTVPLNENDIRSISMVRVYQRWRVDATTDIETDFKSKNFQKPRTYGVFPVRGSMFRVHYSRVIAMDGLELAETERLQNNGWGDSVYQAMFDRLRAQGAIYGATDNIMEDFVQGALTMKNLQEMIAGGQEDVIKKRLDIIDMSRHVINTMLLDEGETYEKKTTSIAGLADVLEKYGQSVSTVSGIPVTLLSGESPAGLNATGASDIRLWYDKIKSEQEENYKPALYRFFYLLQIAKQGPTGGKEIKNWEIVFAPLMK
jgi:phage-related protein (TIGR01555 family)